MPLRDDLLQPIDGQNPSGPSLYYDEVFTQLKKARIEDDESVPTGDWKPQIARRADRRLIVELAGDALAKRSKDLRLAGWYVESLVRREGFPVLADSLALLAHLEQTFWDTIHPEREEDGDLGLRIGTLEAASAMLATQLKLLPLTRSGINLLGYSDARALGMDADSRSAEKQAAREDAVARGRFTGDDLAKFIDGTPKAFYAETEAALLASLAKLEDLDRFHEEQYGDDYPSFGRLKSAITEVHKVVASILVEKRKTDPDPLPVTISSDPEPQPEQAHDTFGRFDSASHADAAVSEKIKETEVSSAIAAPAAPPRKMPSGVLTDAADAYAQVAAASEFLHKETPGSSVSYFLCAALRFGEVRNAEFGNTSFAVAPSTATRQNLRRLALDGAWDDLLQLGLSTFGSPCGCAWLDLQRYLWRAASKRNHYALAAAITSTVRGLLADRPTLRDATLDDDTPCANAETLAWIDAEVLPPAPPLAGEQDPAAPVYKPSVPASTGEPQIYETALAILKQGRTVEAISLLVRDSEQQPSGRMRFTRRVQLAQLCLEADHPAVAYPVLVDLSAEIERRSLETWESSDLLAQPLSLLLHCLEHRKEASEVREAVFARLCRLDPQAALTVRR